MTPSLGGESMEYIASNSSALGRGRARARATIATIASVSSTTAPPTSRTNDRRVESSRVERVSLDWKRPHRVRIARSGCAGRVGDGGDDGAGGRARESRGNARGETTRRGGRVEAREGGEDAGELEGRVGG